MAGPQDFDLSSDSDSSFPKTAKKHFSHAEVPELCSFGWMKEEILIDSLFPAGYDYEVVLS